MIVLENWAKQAQEKLKKERAAVSGKKEKVMADAVMTALMDFCRQEPEFAQAVAQAGSLEECMRKVAAGTGDSISDLEAYRKAVQFYFPGADIQMQLRIDLVGMADLDEVGEKEQKEVPKLMTLDLSSFL